jgi:hypothetical protein
MTKIPVGKTIAYAYGFTFGHFLTVLGLAWVPLALVAVGAYLTLPSYYSGMAAMATAGDVSAGASGLGLMFLFLLILFAGFVMIYVAIARQALGLRTGPAFFYFSLDAAFWRLLLAYLLTMLIAFGLAMVVAIVAGIAAVVFTALSTLVLSVLMSLITLIGIVYVMVRLTFLQPPIAVVEEHRVIRRAWELGKGNFWRMFAVLLGIMVPLMIVQFVIQITLFSSLAITPPPEDASPAEAAAFMAQMATEIVGVLPFLVPIAIVFYAAMIAMIVSASAFAYRSLVPAPEGTAAEFA